MSHHIPKIGVLIWQQPFGGFLQWGYLQLSHIMNSSLGTDVDSSHVATPAQSPEGPLAVARPSATEQEKVQSFAFCVWCIGQ